MTKNPKIRRRTPRQPHMNREIVEMEAYLASERLQNEASYCSRGRRFKPLTDAALKQRWIKCLRRTINADRLRRTEMNDVCAELSLRGISSVKLPPHILEVVTADVKTHLRREHDVSGQKLN
jgi:hypothetical protein